MQKFHAGLLHPVAAYPAEPDPRATTLQGLNETRGVHVAGGFSRDEEDVLRIHLRWE
jgi:hypothetical protein